ncbi:MAG: hypothetical protein IPH48_13870 [bacterium]|nr:hypothetical protein [bacterium]MBK9775941.1 hypothetical protein [bacterium]
MLKTLRAVKFLFTAPLILLLLVVINWLTSPGDWWVQWAALGLGIAWLVALFRVISAIVVVGGLAAFMLWLRRREAGSDPTSPLP